MEPHLSPGGGAAADVIVRHVTGTVADLHARDPFADGPVATPEVWWCDYDGAAVVLGSRQSAGLLDPAAVAAAGLDVVVRRSGGGAVLMAAGAMAWVDIVLPRGAVADDVRASMVAAGRWWRSALVTLGSIGPAARVHDGPMVESAWSRLVCFAGTGPGEVLVDEPSPDRPRKVVGLSQRRTRDGVRIQGSVQVAPGVAATAGLIAARHRPPGGPAEQAVVPGLEPAATAHALAAAMARAERANRS